MGYSSATWSLKRIAAPRIPSMMSLPGFLKGFLFFWQGRFFPQQMEAMQLCPNKLWGGSQRRVKIPEALRGLLLGIHRVIVNHFPTLSWPPIFPLRPGFWEGSMPVFEALLSHFPRPLTVTSSLRSLLPSSSLSLV